uniref:LOB domain-containing protein n=1 Tax=Ananas comosus var. bracteatus TaxID=296719 RepID=A0A6V7Q5E7_ANACO|nr:unnamed protein product [Ananas comosus var. bracteatus]
MRMSCNGCRVLRKGCSEACSIRPCLQWIRSPDSQANATVFLAKFYGRAGLINLLNAGPDHLRPAIFRSLLYEACGRILNPIYGSVGLLWSGSWQLCQEAVEAVLKGAPISSIPASASAAAAAVPPLKTCDIRHVAKANAAAAADLHRVGVRSRTRFKRAGVRKAGSLAALAEPAEEPESDSAEEETAEGSHVSQAEPSESRADECADADADADEEEEEEEVGLDLTLGLSPPLPSRAELARLAPDHHLPPDACPLELGLGLPA